MVRRLLALCLWPLLAACGPSAPPGAAPQPPGEDGAGWTRLPEAPLSGRTGAVVAPVGADAVMVVGGWEFLCPPNADCVTPEEPLLADGALLDLATGAWRPVADAPYGVRDAQTAQVAGDLYLLSGCRAGPSCRGPATLLRYDVDADRWHEPADPPPGLRYADLVPVAGRLLALATTDEYGERADALYDPATDSWTQLPDDPLEAAYDRHAVVDGNRLLVFGSTVDDDGERRAKIGAALDLATMAWRRLPDAPGAGYQVWRMGEEAWLNPHYGEGGGVLDLATGTWRAFPDGPLGPSWRNDLAGLVGEGEAVYEYSSGWVRDTRTDEWLHVPSRPGAGYDEALTAAGEALVVFGGQRWQGEQGELLADSWMWRPPA